MDVRNVAISCALLLWTCAVPVMVGCAKQRAPEAVTPPGDAVGGRVATDGPATGVVVVSPADKPPGDVPPAGRDPHQMPVPPTGTDEVSIPESAPEVPGRPSSRAHLPARRSNLTEVPNDPRPAPPTAPQAAKSCLSNLKQIALASLMYMQDYDERMAPAKDWQAVLMPYLKNESLFHCPALGEAGWGYGRNRAVTGIDLWRVSSYPAQTIMDFDSAAQAPSFVGGLDDLARPGRHDGMDNLSFLDGHAKAYRPERVTQEMWDFP